MELTGKFDLVITSHLLEDLTDPQAPWKLKRYNSRDSGDMEIHHWAQVVHYFEVQHGTVL